MQDEQNRSSNQPSLYAQVTDKIVAELELGIVALVKPWGSGEGTIVLG
jgi:antirestriction protein ArdC